MKFLFKVIIVFIAVFSVACTTISKQEKVTFESLLDEMISVEKQSLFPDPYYKCLQESSYDRSSISKDQKGWFANNDGFGVIRVDTIGDRIENVMFDDKGPGVITRIWITTLDKRGTWRFYFDHSDTANLIIPSYDLMVLKLPGVGKGLIQPHTSYTKEGKGGSTSFLPIPYAKGCKITFEDEPSIKPTPKYYQINYRKYSPNTIVETFSEDIVNKAKKKVDTVNHSLLNAKVSFLGETIKETKIIPGLDSMELILPEGEQAVYEIMFEVDIEDDSTYEQLMRELIFSATFDGKETIWVPLGDFSGGGMGAPYVESWFLFSDGEGRVTSRWLMPYRESATMKLLNISSLDVKATIEVNVSPLAWNKESLYFHASWRQERGIYIHNNPDEEDKCVEWNFATIKGKGVYKGDLLSLFNHAPRWYGEGDEKIWVDNDTFPSHFGTGTEDYYNSSWAPVIPFHTPFGGAPRADLESSHGYNSFFRTRNLDGIPFKNNFRFDLEMLGWDPGHVDYATTIYWYGDYDSKAYGLSGVKEAKQRLHPAPPNPADFKIPNSLEFENLQYSSKSKDLRVEIQSLQGFPDGVWSGAKHIVCSGGEPNDFIEFTFKDLLEEKYRLILYSTKANDYGVITFLVNDEPTNITFDGFHENVTNSGSIDLGVFSPDSNIIKIKVQITGSNPKSKGEGYLFGLDCIQLLPIKESVYELVPHFG